jgi:hypothetical protein
MVMIMVGNDEAATMYKDEFKVHANNNCNNTKKAPKHAYLLSYQDIEPLSRLVISNIHSMYVCLNVDTCTADCSGLLFGAAPDLGHLSITAAHHVTNTVVSCAKPA